LEERQFSRGKSIEERIEQLGGRKKVTVKEVW